MHPTAPFHLSDAQVAVVSLLCLLVLIVAVFWHGRYIKQLRRRIPIVVHVGGTRGKTTTVLTLAQALERRGHRVVAKTTGSEPLLHLPTGRLRKLRRLGPPSISEQRTALKMAAREGADVLVVECMAIRPEFVWASHALVLRPDLTIITNTRADHAEDLGRDADAMAVALAPLVAGPGKLVLPSDANSLLEREARRSGTPLSEVDPGPTIESQIRSLVRGALRALACEAGPPIEVVGDAGAFSLRQIHVNDVPLMVADAFAANDPESLALRWRQAASEVGNVVVLAARRDRPERNRAFLREFPRLRPAPTHVFIVGDERLRRYLEPNGMGGIEVEFLAASRAAEIWLRVQAVLPPGGLVWGVGNRVGVGDALLSGRS